MIRNVLAHDSHNCQQDQRRLYHWANEILSAARINIAFIADTIWSRKSTTDEHDEPHRGREPHGDDCVVADEDSYRRLNRSLWIRTCKIAASHEKITTLPSSRGPTIVRKRRRVRDVIPESRLAIYGDYEYTGALSDDDDEVEKEEEVVEDGQPTADSEEVDEEDEEQLFAGRMDITSPIPIDSFTNGNNDRVVVSSGSYKETIGKNDDDDVDGGSSSSGAAAPPAAAAAAKESWMLAEIDEYMAKIDRMSCFGDPRRRRQRRGLDTPSKCDKSNKDSRNNTTSERTAATSAAQQEMKQQAAVAAFSELIECEPMPPALRFSVNNVSEAQLEGRIFNEAVRNLWKTSSNDRAAAATTANFYPYQDYQLHQQQQHLHHHHHQRQQQQHHQYYQQQQQQSQYLSARNLRQSQMELQRELSLLKPITTTTTIATTTTTTTTSCCISNRSSIGNTSSNCSNRTTTTTTTTTTTMADGCNSNSCGNVIAAAAAVAVDLQHTHCSFQSERLRMPNRCPYSYVQQQQQQPSNSLLVDGRPLPGVGSLGVDVPEFFPQSSGSCWMDEQSVKELQQQQQQQHQQQQLQYYPQQQQQLESVYATDELIHYKAATRKATTVAMYQNTLVPMVATPIVNAVVWPTVQPSPPWVRAGLLPAAATIQMQHHQMPQSSVAPVAAATAAQIQLQQQQQQQQQVVTRPATLAQVVHRPIRTTELAAAGQQPLQRSQAQKAAGGGGGVTQIPVYQRAGKASASEYQRRKNQGVDYNNLILLTKSAMKVRRSQTKATKKSFVDTAKLQHQQQQAGASKTNLGTTAMAIANSSSTAKWLEKGQQQQQLKREREFVTISMSSCSTAASIAAATSSNIDKTPARSTCSLVSNEDDDEIAATASSFYHHKQSKKLLLLQQQQQQPQQTSRQAGPTKKRLYRDVVENTRQQIPLSESTSDGSFERRYDELEKQAMEQYRTSEECLALRYQELEQQALEQYKAIEGSESMINLEHDRRSQASTRSSSQRGGGGGGACSDQDDKLSLCSNNSSLSSSTTTTAAAADNQAAASDQHPHHQHRRTSYATTTARTTPSSSSFSNNNNNNNYAKRSDARGNELARQQQQQRRIKILKLPSSISASADTAEVKDIEEMTRRVDNDKTTAAAASAAAASALTVMHRAASEGSLQRPSNNACHHTSTAAALAKRFSACQGVAAHRVAGVVAACRGFNNNNNINADSGGSSRYAARGGVGGGGVARHRLANARDKIVKTSSLMSLRCNLTPVVPIPHRNDARCESPSSRQNLQQKVHGSQDDKDDDDEMIISQKKLDQRVGLLYSHQQQSMRKSNQQGSGDDQIDDLSGHLTLLSL